MRVRIQRPHKKTIIIHIHKNNAYLLAAMDQDADSVWVMTLNCLGHNNAYSHLCVIHEYTLVRIRIIENMHYCDSDTN